MSDKNNKNGQPSMGSLTFTETINGDLQIRLDINEQQTTDENLLRRLKAALAGLAYIYEQDTENIDRIGIAFLDGMDLGRKVGEGQNKPHKGKGKTKGSQYSGSKIGYGAKV